MKDAEDAVQDAFAIALERWPRTGVPDNPGAWIVTTARNRAIDRIRRDHVLADQDPPPSGTVPRSTKGCGCWHGPRRSAGPV